MYEYLEHEADMGIRGIGKTIEEAFSEGAEGMYEVMVDTEKIESKKEKTFKVQSDSIEGLYVEFLNELLSITGIGGLVFSKFVVKIKKNEEYDLSCKAYGENLDQKKHNIKTEVKAATYSGLKYWTKEGKHFIQCIVDV